MFGSTNTSRRLAGLAVVAAAFAALIPVAQADSGFQGPPDAIDRAVATRQAELGSTFNGSPDAVDRAVGTRQSEEAAAFDAREHAQLALTSPAPDVIERVALAQQQHTLPETGRTTASALVQSPTQAATSNGFDWSDSASAPARASASCCSCWGSARACGRCDRAKGRFRASKPPGRTM